MIKRTNLVFPFAEGIPSGVSSYLSGIKNTGHKGSNLPASPKGIPFPNVTPLGEKIHKTSPKNRILN